METTGYLQSHVKQSQGGWMVAMPGGHQSTVSAHPNSPMLMTPQSHAAQFQDYLAILVVCICNPPPPTPTYHTASLPLSSTDLITKFSESFNRRSELRSSPHSPSSPTSPDYPAATPPSEKRERSLLMPRVEGKLLVHGFHLHAFCLHLGDQSFDWWLPLLSYKSGLSLEAHIYNACNCMKGIS